MFHCCLHCAMLYLIEFEFFKVSHYGALLVLQPETSKTLGWLSEQNILLNTLFVSPALHILRSEMKACSLSVMSGILKSIRSALLRPCIVVLNICKDICELDWYFGYLWGNTFPEFFTPKEQPWIRNCSCRWSDQMAKPLVVARAYKNVPMGPVVRQCILYC